MRFVLGLVLATVALGAALTDGVALGREAPSACARPAHVVVANSSARIVRRDSELWLCGKSRPEGYLLGNNSRSLTGASVTGHVRLAGRFVAWATELQDHERNYFYVRVRDAVRGGGHAFNTGGRADTDSGAGIGPATAVVVTSRGSVAWIAHNDSTGGYEVHSVVGNNRRLVSAASGIDPRSLASAGRTIYWTEDGNPRSASF